MQVEFVNAYIERLVKEVGELTKNRLLLETQLIIAEKTNIELNERLNKYEQQAVDTAVKKSLVKKDSN